MDSVFDLKVFVIVMNRLCTDLFLKMTEMLWRNFYDQLGILFLDLKVWSHFPETRPLLKRWLAYLNKSQKADHDHREWSYGPAWLYYGQNFEPGPIFWNLHFDLYFYKLYCFDSSVYLILSVEITLMISTLPPVIETSQIA